METGNSMGKRLKRFFGILMSFCMVLGMIGVMPAREAKADSDPVLWLDVNFLKNGKEADYLPDGFALSYKIGDQSVELSTTATGNDKKLEVDQNHWFHTAAHPNVAADANLTLTAVIPVGYSVSRVQIWDNGGVTHPGYDTRESDPDNILSVLNAGDPLSFKMNKYWVSDSTNITETKVQITLVRNEREIEVKFGENCEAILGAGIDGDGNAVINVAPMKWDDATKKFIIVEGGQNGGSITMVPLGETKITNVFFGNETWNDNGTEVTEKKLRIYTNANYLTTTFSPTTGNGYQFEHIGFNLKPDNNNNKDDSKSVELSRINTETTEVLDLTNIPYGYRGWLWGNTAPYAGKIEVVIPGETVLNDTGTLLKLDIDMLKTEGIEFADDNIRTLNLELHWVDWDDKGNETKRDLLTLTKYKAASGDYIIPMEIEDANHYKFVAYGYPLIKEGNRTRRIDLTANLVDSNNNTLYADVNDTDSGNSVELDLFNLQNDGKFVDSESYRLYFDNLGKANLRTDSQEIRITFEKKCWTVDTDAKTATYIAGVNDRFNALGSGLNVTLKLNDAFTYDVKSREGEARFIIPRNSIPANAIEVSGSLNGTSFAPAIRANMRSWEMIFNKGTYIDLSYYKLELPSEMWIDCDLEDAFEPKEYHFWGMNLTPDVNKGNGNTYTLNFVGYDPESAEHGAPLDYSVNAGTMTVTFPSDAIILDISTEKDNPGPNYQEGTVWSECVRFITTAKYADVAFNPAAGYVVDSHYNWEDIDCQHYKNTNGEPIYHFEYNPASTSGSWRVNCADKTKLTCDCDFKGTIINTEFISKTRQIFFGGNEDILNVDYSNNSVVVTYCHDGYEKGYYEADPNVIAGTITYTVPSGYTIQKGEYKKEYFEYEEDENHKLILDTNGNPVVKRSWFDSYFLTDSDTLIIKAEPAKGYKVYALSRDYRDAGHFEEDVLYEAKTVTDSFKNLPYGEAVSIYVDFAEYLGTMIVNVDSRYATVEGNTVTQTVNNTGNKIKYSVTVREWDDKINDNVFVPFYPEVKEMNGYKIYSWIFDVDERWGHRFQVENASTFGNTLSIYYGNYATNLVEEDGVKDLIDFAFLEDAYREGRMSGNMEYTLSFSVPVPQPVTTPTPTPQPTSTPTPTPEQAENAAVTTPAPVQPVTEETTEVEKIGNSTTTTTVTENEDGSTTTVAETVNKDGSSTTTTSTTVVKEDGSTETVAETVNSDGTSSTTTTTVKENADGSVETVSETVNSDGTSSTTTATTVENEDGSKTTEALTENSDGTTVEETKTENADGSSSSVSVLKDEDGNTLATTSEDVSFNKYGTEVVETKVENADGSVVESVVKTTQAGKVVAQTAETDPEGNTTITLETEKTNGVDVVKTFVAEEDGIKLTEYQTEGKKATIPSTIEVGDTVYEVKTIGEGAFEGNESLEKITIPDTVETIGANAFNGAKSLKSVNLENVKTIGDNAFKNAKNLKKITLGSDLESISKGAFKGIPKNAKITILAPTEDKFNEIKNLIIESGVKKKNVNFVWKRTEE